LSLSIFVARPRSEQVILREEKARRRRCRRRGGVDGGRGAPIHARLALGIKAALTTKEVRVGLDLSQKKYALVIELDDASQRANRPAPCSTQTQELKLAPSLASPLALSARTKMAGDRIT
jgi:hypothetical protein